jgi:hypothetical protein
LAIASLASLHTCTDKKRQEPARFLSFFILVPVFLHTGKQQNRLSPASLGDGGAACPPEGLKTVLGFALL